MPLLMLLKVITTLHKMRKIASSLAFKFIGKPYVWAGDDAIAGFDCSGFIIEILKSVGILPRSGDWAACHLYEVFKQKERWYKLH